MQKMRLCSLLTSLMILASCAVAQDAATQIRNELERLQKFAAAQQADDQLWKDLKPGVDRFLTMANVSLRSGNLYYAVEAIGKANQYIVGYRWSKQDSEVLKKGAEAFQKNWKESHVALASLEQTTRQKNWTGLPAAVRALVESHQGQVGPSLEGGRAFANLNDFPGGYYYLGEGRGNEESARFAASISLQRKGTAFVPRSILPELQKLQDRTNVAFVPPRSIEKHPQFIRLNATLKTAAELDAAKLYAGALYQYLQALSYFEAMDAPAPDAAKQGQLKAAIENARREAKTSGRDDSIAELFVQRAEALIATKSGVEASAEEWKNAAAVVDYVIPAYYAALKSHAAQPVHNKDAVTLTLVRWPYT
jgi:hypothetical protein